MSLADDIEAEAGALAFDYPKGASLTDIAGYFGAPLPQVEQALMTLRKRGVSLAFIRGDPLPPPTAHLNSEAAKKSREASEAAQRAHLLRHADVVSLEDGPILTGRNGGALSDLMQDALQSLGGSIDANGHGRFASEKNPDAVALGRRGGRKGGPARAETLTADERSNIARKGAEARWGTNEERIKDRRRKADATRWKNVVEEIAEANAFAEYISDASELTATEKLVNEITANAAALVMAFPMGCTARELATYFSAPMQPTYEAISKLSADGIGAWESRLDGTTNTHHFYLRGMMVPPPLLTKNQEAVYCEVLRAEQDGRAVVNYTAIGKKIDLPQGSVVQVCSALEHKGLLQRMTPWYWEESKGGKRTGKQPSPEYLIFPCEPRQPNFEKTPRRSLARHNVPKVPDKEVHARALERKAELEEELRRVNAFLVVYEKFAGK